MKSLGDSLRKTLSHRHMGRQMIGAIALNIVRDFFAKQDIEGYVRFTTMFLNVSDQSLKIQIFKQKNQILHEVNLALNKVGYTTIIKEIRLIT